MPQGAHGGLGDLLPVPGRDDGPDQRLYPPDLAHGHLVLLVVAGEVGQDARGTGDNVDICGAKELHQPLHQIIQLLYLSFRIH